MEGRCFTVFTDHKPLTTALASQVERSPRQTRHLSFIAEFTSDIRHIKGTENVEADALSRVDAIARQVDVWELAAEQKKSAEVASNIGNLSSGLEVKRIQCGGHELICDVSTGRSRAVVPLSMRRQVFEIYHELSHAGPRPTQKAVLKKFVWKNLKKDIIAWCRTCVSCQTSKVATHIKTPWARREPPDRRFGSLHVDLVSPLPESEGHKYLFTIVDQFSRWPEAIPLKDMTAVTCARAFLRHWVSRYGLPSDITSDRGRQFTSELWGQLHEMLGVRSQNTTAYHPQANGLVERLHRQLKSSIMARSTSTDWMDQLPMVMLGIRTAWRTELDCSPAELVFGTSLTVPGLIIGDGTQDRQGLPTTEFVSDLLKKMRELNPVEMSHHATPKVNMPSSIGTADFVYVRTDAARQPLVRPYTGPFKVLSRSDKYFKILKNGKPDAVSVDRLKPAFLYEENNNRETRGSEKQEKVTQPRLSSRKSPEAKSEKSEKVEKIAAKSEKVAAKSEKVAAKAGRVAAKPEEVAVRDYRAALLRDATKNKRTYVRAEDLIRKDASTTRAGRASRPHSRL